MTQAIPATPVFDSTAHIVNEIDDALRCARITLSLIEGGRLTKSLDVMSRAHAELEKLLGQSRLLSESLGRVIQFHLNRRKAQS